MGGSCGGPGEVRMLGGSVVRGPLTEVAGVLDASADERTEVPDGASASWKYAYSPLDEEPHHSVG
jgi:hypothetical protein